MANGRPNKRGSERVRTALPVVWVRRGRRDELVAADISQEGMFLRTEELIEPGQLMHLEVRVPAGKPLLVFAATRFCGRTVAGAGMGVKFYVISDNDRRRWLSHYRELLRQRPARPAPMVALGA